MNHRRTRARASIKAAVGRIKAMSGKRPRRTVWVSGVPRSGTNMIMEMFDRSWDAYVLHEADPRAFENFHLRSDASLISLWRHGGHDTLVIKALLDGHRLPDLLDRFPNSRVIWAYRDPWATVKSNRRKWPNGRNQLEAVIDDPESAGYRGRGMTPETLGILRRVYRPDCSAAEAMALFWWYRHRLFFTQALASDDRAILVNYERLARDPERVGSQLCHAIGLEFSPEMIGHISAPSAPEQPSEPISDEVRQLCLEMWQSLDANAHF